MSAPDPKPSVSVAVSRSSETPMTQPNTVKTPSFQRSYRAIAPFHRQPQQSIHPHPFPVRRTNTGSGSPLQDPSTLVYPGRGLSTRPGTGRQIPSTISDPAGSPGGYPPPPVYAYQNGQGFDPMCQFMRAAAHPQIQPASHLGSGHIKGVPHFLQPRVAHPPPTSFLENGGRKNARSRNDVLVLIRKRKVRITEGASLYSLCRSWLRNGAYEGVQKQQSDTITCLPKPLPADMVETSLPNDLVEEDKEDEESVKQLSDSHLLKRHVDRAKKVRARLREERLKRIGRYKARLALLLPLFGEQCRDG